MYKFRSIFLRFLELVHFRLVESTEFFERKFLRAFTRTLKLRRNKKTFYVYIHILLLLFYYFIILLFYYYFVYAAVTRRQQQQQQILYRYRRRIDQDDRMRGAQQQHSLEEEGGSGRGECGMKYPARFPDRPQDPRVLGQSPQSWTSSPASSVGPGAGTQIGQSVGCSSWISDKFDVQMWSSQVK